MSRANRLYILLIIIAVMANISYSHGANKSAFSNTPGNNLYSDTVESNKTDSNANKLIDSIKQNQLFPQKPDSLALTTSNTTAFDSLSVTSDTLKSKKDTISHRKKYKQADLETGVDFKAKDSLVIIGNNNAYLYGEGDITYGAINLKAEKVEMNLDKSMVHAIGKTDSIGDRIGEPVFTDPSGTYESETMDFNFKTKRGYITNVITEQGEGYLTGGKTKKMENDEFYMENARYTTCDDHDCPHFYMQLTKAKVRPKKNIVTGPAYMVLAGVPLPLAVPFGFFPFSQKYSSGIIFPTFGEDYSRGFYLRDGGYYFAFNENVDLALTGEIYTKGSWGITAQSAYVKRYKFSGNFNVSYITSIYGEKGSSDYSKQNNFKIAWTHTQDSKSNPNMSLSASVNFTTSGYTRNDLNSVYNSSQFTENTKSSTINWGYRFPNSKWSVNASMNVSQRTQDSTLTMSFPNLTLTLSQIYPFKRKNKVGNDRWYEKITLSYSGLFQNNLTSKQDVFFKKSLIKDWRNGMKHSIRSGATFNVLKYINISPSISITDRMYTNKILRDWDQNIMAEVADTTYGFYNVYDFSAGISASTKVYGFFQPMKFLGDKVKMIRHVFTPTVSLSASPDFGASFFGFWKDYTYTDASGKEVTKKYSPFSNGIYGTTSTGKSGMVSFSLDNNLEMKVKSDADSTGVKKISLIEKLSLSSAYNFAADSMRWSNISSSILLKLAKNFNLNLSATWDVYTYALNSSGNPVRVNKLRIANGKGFGRLMSTGTSFSYTFNNNTFKRKKKKDVEGTEPNTPNNEEVIEQPKEERKSLRNKEKGDVNVTDDGYMKWEVPWSLTANYSINYGYGSFNKEKMEYDSKITQNLSISGNISPTKNWAFSFQTSYNFDTHKLAYMNCTISRDLHCFTMSASFIPVGPYKSYNFHISVKSALLSDLKYDKRSSTSSITKWY